ncbi:MAG: hypothetical protein LiPW41_524 [Parcubacteria group bacterium LiPW_41]|nr:MAG: hypothetical protein LiPW41_524 [Parcubacteria group bacterium LiPW_41]
MEQTYIDQLEYHTETAILDPELELSSDFLNDAYKDVQYTEKTILSALDDFLATKMISKQEYLILFSIYLVCAEKYKGAAPIFKDALLFDKKERELCCLFFDEHNIMSETIRAYLTRILNREQGVFLLD